MTKVITWTISLAIVGLIVGYLIFGRLGGEYLNLHTLISPAKNLLEDLAQSVTGVEAARTHILIAGAVGAGLGLLAGLITNNSK